MLIGFTFSMKFYHKPVCPEKLEKVNGPILFIAKRQELGFRFC